MNPATYDTIQAHLHDLRRHAALHRHLPVLCAPGSRTMLAVTTTSQIARPAHEVFAFLEDFTNNPLWNYRVRHVTKDPDAPIEVGTVFHQTRRDDQQLVVRYVSCLSVRSLG